MTKLIAPTRRPITCVEFCRKTIGLELTLGQEAFLAVAVDGRLPRELRRAVRDAALTMFGDIEEIPPLARHVALAVLGRDSGKTELGAAVALFKLFTVDLSRVGEGDIPVVALVAPREKTARIALRRALARVRARSALRSRLESSSKDGFTLRRPDGRLVAFEVFAASRGGASLRGPSFIAVVFDEAAQFRDASSSVVNDEELFAAVMPRLLPGGVVLFLSTPWSEEGLFWTLASENLGAPATAIVAQASTLVMRDNDPHNVAKVEAERQRDPDNAAREFDAQFMVTGGSLLFDPQSITDAIDDSATGARGADEGISCGADLGLIKDSSAIAVVAAREEKLRLLELVELRPTREAPLKLSAVIGAFAEICTRHGASSFMADGHAREPAREYTDRHGIEITSAPEGREAKYSSYIALRQAFSERRIRIPNHPRLLVQLRAVKKKPMTGGTFAIFTPRRAGLAHGDLVSALVLAVWSVGPGAEITFDPSFDEYLPRWRDAPGQEEDTNDWSLDWSGYGR